jgi:hypothetical protein
MSRCCRLGATSGQGLITVNLSAWMAGDVQRRLSPVGVDVLDIWK